MNQIKDHKLQCPECAAPMRLIRHFQFGKPFYGCSKFPKCRGSHGAHADGRPLGKPADQATKKLRILAHDWFDQLWKECGYTRKEAYSMLADQLKVKEVHIGEQDAEGCQAVIQAARILIENYRNNGTK